MRIVLLAGSSSIHTVRWANGLSGAGHVVHVISQHPTLDPFDPLVNVHHFPYRGVLGYFTMVPAVRRLIQQIQPDIVNAHYASGYGTTARLVNFHPWILSVWGSDVYDFPHTSPLHKWLIRKNLCAADQVASTSYCMADETRKLTLSHTDIAITPFGVDVGKYSGITPLSTEQNPKLVIGTIKTMSPKYGIDTLITAYSILVRRFDHRSDVTAPELELRLIGGGGQVSELKALVEELGISNHVKFVGRVSHTEVPKELAGLDIYVALSRLDSESFGVAIIEAGAAGRPVVVSNAGGLPEVTIDGVTGFVVTRENPEAAADAIEKLVLDAELRRQMGIAGRHHVSKHYAWDACINTMINVYKQTIQNYRNAG